MAHSENPYVPMPGCRPGVFAGRREHLAAFDAQLNDADGAEICVLLGLHGVGKTVLLAELADRARTAGWSVLETCVGDGTGIPLLDDPRLRLCQAVEAEPGGGVVVFVDEVQGLSDAHFAALIQAVADINDDGAVVRLVAAGLPSAEWLVENLGPVGDRVQLGSVERLDRDDARWALEGPARLAGRLISEPALEFIVGYTEGFPRLLQEFGHAVWDLTDGDIDFLVAMDAVAIVEDRLDAGFFEAGLEGTGADGRTYLRAMAELGPGAQAIGEVAALLGAEPHVWDPTRNHLIEQGLLCPSGYGLASFAFPQFNHFLMRRLPWRDQVAS